jgi:putative methyltransferase (TIGR04325 family)
MLLKQAIRELTPPILLRVIQMARKRGLLFQGDYADWNEAQKASRGYEQNEIVQRVFEAEMKVKRGEAMDARDGVPFDAIQFSLPMMAGILRAAACRPAPLNVVDFGGGFGGLYRQYKALGAPGPVNWAVVEQRAFTALGIAHFQNDELRFFEKLEDALQARVPDLLLLSSVLQYLPEPYAFLNQVMASGATELLIDRTPCGTLQRDVLAVQTVPPEIYPASYPCWIFSRERLLKALAPQYRVLASFTDGTGRWSSDVTDFELTGFILDRTTKADV